MMQRKHNSWRRWALVACFVAVASQAVAEDKAEAPEKQGVPVWSLDVTPDGSLLVAAGGNRGAMDRGVLQIWDTRDWSNFMLLSEKRAATCVAFSPNKFELAVGTQTGEVLIVDLATKKVNRRWPSGQWAVFGITWTPTGNEIVSACASGIIKTWDAKTAKLTRILDTWQADGTTNPMQTGHSDRNIWDVAVSADGNTLLSAGWNDTTRVWDLRTGALVQEFSETDSSMQGIKFTPDEKFFASVGLSSTQVRETETLRVRATLPASGRDLSIHPDGQTIAIATMQEVQVFKVHLKRPANEDAQRYQKLISQLGDGDTKVQAAAAAELETIGAPAEPLLFEVLNAANIDLRTRARQLWEKRMLALPRFTLDTQQQEVRQVVYSPNGKFLVSATLKGEVVIWDTEQYKPQHVFTVTVPE